MNCDYLVEFVTVARVGSLTTAASELSLSQSTLSRHMRSLEQDLGLPLLNRRNNGVELTEPGRYVYNRAGDIIDAVEDIRFYARERIDSSQLVFGGMTIYPSAMKQVMDACAALPQRTRVKVLPAGSFEDSGITDLLGQHRAGVYLTLDTDSRLDFLDDGYEVVEFFQTPVVVIMEPSNPYANRSTLSIQDLDGQTLLHAQTQFDGEKINWEDTKFLLRSAGIDYRSKTCTLESKEDMLFDQKNEMFLLPEAYAGVEVLRASRKVVLRLHDQSKTVVAVCRAGEPVAGFISSLHIGMLL
ncbi:MAG: LysR family transcriptional regulator [Eggerthellaceae bacterium]|jgi:DNA-binding transcriptional LysR family regulator